MYVVYLILSVGGGVGKIFVEFTDVGGASKARSVVAGRTFNGNLVGAEYYPEGLFMKKVSLFLYQYRILYMLGHYVMLCYGS